MNVLNIYLTVSVLFQNNEETVVTVFLFLIDLHTDYTIAYSFLFSSSIEWDAFDEYLEG